MTNQTKWYFVNPLRHIDMPRGARTANARNTTFTQKMISCFKTISGTIPHYDEDERYQVGEAGLFDWLTVGITYFLMYAETNLVGPKSKHEKLNRLLRGAIFLILTLPVLILKGVRLVFSGVGTLLALPVLALVHVLFSKIPKWWEERSQAKVGPDSQPQQQEEDVPHEDVEEAEAIAALKKAEQDYLNLPVSDLIFMRKSMSPNITAELNVAYVDAPAHAHAHAPTLHFGETSAPKKKLLQAIVFSDQNKEQLAEIKMKAGAFNSGTTRFFTKGSIGAAVAALDAALDARKCKDSLKVKEAIRIKFGLQKADK